MPRRISFTPEPEESDDDRRYVEVSTIGLEELFRCVACGTLVTDRHAHDEHHARTDW